MKNGKVCPKCGSTDILRIPGKAGAYGSGNNIPNGPTIFQYIKVTRYLCCNCGFTEEWIDDAKDIITLKKRYGQNTQYL